MGHVRRTAFLLFCVAMGACTAKRSESRATPDSTRTPIPPPSSNPPTGPVTMVGDSNAGGARLDVSSGNAVLHLPLTSFKTLFDSLPDFKPFPVSSYDSAVWASEVEQDSTAILPSVVLGDFDADGRMDAAMIGSSRDTTAELIVLSSINQSHSVLLYINPRMPGGRSGKSDVLLRLVSADEMANRFKIRRDAVQIVDIGKGSIIAYWDNGVLRQIQTGD